MKIQSISASYGLSKISSVSSVPKISKQNFNEIPRASFILAFKGGNPNQIISIATESNYLDGIYKAGGLGCVTDEAPEAIKEAGKDIRTFLPYYTFGDASKEGKIWVKKTGASGASLSDFVLVPKDYKLKDGEAFSLITVVKNGKVQKSFDLKEIAEGTTKRMGHSEKLEMVESPYRMFKIVQQRVLDKNNVKIVAPRADAHYIVHSEELARGGKAYGHETNYKEQLDNLFSKIKNATLDGGSGASGKYDPSKNTLHGFKASEIFYKDFWGAILGAQKTLNDIEGFKPQTYWLHDRFCYSMIPEVIERAAKGDKDLQGLRFFGMLHNCGRGYQGVYHNPLEFFKVLATEAQFNALKARPDFDKIQQLSNMMMTPEGVTPENAQLLENVFAPVIGRYKDDLGYYNLTKVIIDHTKEDHNHFSLGTVSQNFGKEMADSETADIAEGLTNSLKEVEKYTHNITNGSRPASMKTNEFGSFGDGTLNEIFTNPDNECHYRVFDNKLSDNPDVRTKQIQTIFDAKATNKRNLINIIAEATEQKTPTNDTIAGLFMGQSRQDGYKVHFKDLELSLGGMSKYQDGDILILGWGRPDPQKGMPITLEAIKKYFSDDNIPLETKLKTKFLIGAGGGGGIGNFQDSKIGEDIITNQDWASIKNIMQEIAEIEVKDGETVKKGLFKNNCIYVNGFFPNRLANCADAAVFTSRFEPCGITPLEAFATGTPVISTNTGGAPDLVKAMNDNVKTVTNETGFLTKDAYMINASRFKGLPPVTDMGYSSQLDKVRSSNIAGQISDAIKRYIEIIENDGSNQKKFIENTLSQKIGWNENAAFNSGRSAIVRHMTESFALIGEIKKLSEKTIAEVPALKQAAEEAANIQTEYKGTINKVLGPFIERILGIGRDKSGGAGSDNIPRKWGWIITAGVALAGAVYYFYNQKSSTGSKKPAVTDKNAKTSASTSLKNAAKMPSQVKINKVA